MLMPMALAEKLLYFTEQFDGSMDFVVRRFRITDSDAALVTIDGMVNKQTVAQSILNPIMSAVLLESEPPKKLCYISDYVLSTVDQKKLSGYDESMTALMSGFALLFIDGSVEGLAIGVQGFQFRGVGEPQNEVVQRGSRESFVEPYQINMSLIRRRIKSPLLKFERMEVGSVSKTGVCICYMRGKVSPELVGRVKDDLKRMKVGTVLAAGYVSAFLAPGAKASMFTGVGYSERPDTICGKLTEGRVAIIVDGTPNVLIVPSLFVENFQSFDDYSNRPFYATFTRWLKYLAFFISMFLPGLYVSATTFHPELLPEPLLLKIAQAEASTPFPIMVEAIIIHLIYEIMREAGLRVPRPLSHAVSIVGGLVIGDAAVTSGLIGAPTLMVIALTAISSYVVPTLYEPVAILRLVFIVIGGTVGFWGVMLAAMAVLANICAQSPYGVPYSAPLAPLKLKDLRDVLVRRSWRTLGKRVETVQDMPGAHIEK